MKPHLHINYPQTIPVFQRIAFCISLRQRVQTVSCISRKYVEKSVVCMQVSVYKEEDMSREYERKHVSCC